MPSTRSCPPTTKHWITTRFADVAGTSPDVDRRLLSIRAALTPEYAEGFDWYDDWLVRLWWKNGKDWKSFLRWLEHSRANADRPAPETGQLLESGDETFFADGIVGIRRAWQLAGWGTEPEDVSPSYTHDRLLAFLDELVRDSSGWDSPLRDRPDAYAATQHLAGLTERPPGWSDSEWDNLAGHLGLPLQPRPETPGDEDDIPLGRPLTASR